MKRAFSLIELLVALSVLAVVAAIIIPRFINTQKQAAAAVATAQQQTIQGSTQQFLSLGGNIQSGTSSSSILSFLANRTVLDGSISDNPNPISSTTISLPITPVNSTVSGISLANNAFYTQASKDAYYVNSAGQLYDVSINPTSGVTTFTPTTQPSGSTGSGPGTGPGTGPIGGSPSTN